jgi:hypothetical protein
MRLAILDNGFTGLSWWKAQFAKRAFGSIPSVLAVTLYRPKFFGKDFTTCFSKNLLHTKAWSRGEAELFAAFVSRLNQCQF